MSEHTSAPARARGCSVMVLVAVEQFSKMQRDGSIGPDNMGSDPDHNRSRFNGVMKIKAEFKYVEDSQ